jgi:hypothetical protein
LFERVQIIVSLNPATAFSFPRNQIISNAAYELGIEGVVELDMGKRESIPKGTSQTVDLRGNQGRYNPI